MSLTQTHVKLSFILLVFLLIFEACSSGDSAGEESISTDLVTNPISASGDVDDDLKVEITFEDSKYDFGKIIQGERIAHSFHFKNTGEAPLIISSVGASCGCTVPSWNKEPIEPGESGKIDVVFDSDGKQGIQSRDITIVSNAVPNTSVIRLIGEVVVP